MTKGLLATEPSQVLLVDDHPILRHGIAQLIGRDEEFVVCGEAGGVDEALALLADRHVDLMVVDLSLEDRSGLDLIRTARARHPQVQSLVLSMHDERLHAERALRAGARGYVMKQEATRKIVAALRHVRAGHIYLGEAIATDLLARLAAAAPAAVDAVPSGVRSLSDRELEVLRLIARGLKTGAIARTLNRSVHTVETHRASIKRKLGLRTSGELAKAAFALASDGASDI
ncbi:MAG: response regulator transcription factor [Betaproteobacteria bacterium]|nr:response regulator transcription factor [Betaproteobacteria bacterium]